MVQLTRQQVSPIGVAALAILVIAGLLWRIQGISLFLSLFTIHDAIHKALSYVVEQGTAQTYIQLITGLLALSLIISEILKPRFSKALEKYVPSWLAKLIFMILVVAAMQVPATGLADLFAQLGGLIIAVLVPALQAIAQYAGSAGEGATAAITMAVAVLVYVYILRVISNLVTKPKYDMWTTSLIVMGLGYTGGLIFGIFTVMGYNMIRHLLGVGSGSTAVLFEIIAIALVAEALSEAWKEAPKLSIRAALWLPAVNILLLAIKDVLGAYAWIVNVLTLLFTFTGVGAAIWGILFQNASLYTTGCAYCASLLAMYSVYEKAIAAIS